MKKKYIVLCILVIISASIFIAGSIFPSPVLAKILTTLIWITALFIALSIVLEEVIRRNVTDSRSRYTATKVISAIELVLISAAIALIWINDIQALMVFFGIIGAGIAIALQDVFKNVAGSLTILLTGVYGVGDRIEIEGRYGDVMDVGIMNTTMMEIREWVAGDQPTGRLIIIPNGQIVTRSVQNFTKDHSFLWDEIQITVTNDSDWRRAVAILTRIAIQETEEIALIAEKEIERIGEKFFLPKKDITPAVYITLTDNWILLSVRFVTYARKRRAVRSRLSQLIIEAFEEEKGIEIGSETLNIQLTDRR